MLDLEAIERIKQLKGRYYLAIDTCDIATLRDRVFTPDATLKLVSPSYTIAAEGWPELERFFVNSFSATRFGMHQGHHGDIEVEGDVARGTWYLHDIYINLDEGKLIQGSALYSDEYVRIDGDWRVRTTGYRRLLETVSPVPADMRIGCSPYGALAGGKIQPLPSR